MRYFRRAEITMKNTRVCCGLFRTPVLIGLFWLLLSVSTAHAQNSGVQSTASAPASEQSGIPDIVVVAEKREENLQKVPIAITAVSSATLDQLHATNIADLDHALPNVQIDNFASTPNAAAFYIRGIGINDADPYTGNTVSIVVDGVPNYFSDGALVELYDVQRIEVLRGPQGTLFGANATGGVINILSEQPTNKFGGHAEVTNGNYNRADVSATVNIPINDVLATRLSVLHTQRDGFYTNIVNGDSEGGMNVSLYRLSTKFSPTDNFDATLIGEYDLSRNEPVAQVNGAVPGEVRYVAPGTIVNGSSLPQYPSPCVPAGQPCHAPDTYYAAQDGQIQNHSDLDTERVTLTMNLRNTALGDLTSITGFKRFLINEFADENGTARLGNGYDRHSNGWQASEELRSQIDWSSAMKSTLGAFYMTTHYDQFQNNLAQTSRPGFSQVTTQNQDNHSISAFGQNYFNITDNLRLQGGVRYTHETTNLGVGVFNYINPSGVANFTGSVPSPGDFTAAGNRGWNNLGWKLGLDYQAAEHAMLYASYAHGFKSGGFVGRITTPQAIGPFDPEKVDTYEIGAKTDFLDRRLRVDVAGFFTNYHDMQLPEIAYIPNAQGVILQANTIQNVPKAIIKGVELETTARPVDALTLTLTAASLNATYRDFCYRDTAYHPASGMSDPGCPTTVEGTPTILRNMKGYALQNSPRWNGTAGAAYEFAVAGGKMTAHALYEYTGKKYLSAIDDSPRATIQPTGYTDANLDWMAPSEKWSLGLFVNNVFDKRYIAQSLDLPGQWALVTYGPPRQFGGTFKVRW
jgi:iron complex outermembrane recepter protein